MLFSRNDRFLAIYVFLATNLRQGIDGDIEFMLGICVQICLSLKDY